MNDASNRRGRRVLPAIAAVTLLGGAAFGALTLSPAVAQEVRTLGAIANSVITCHATSPCAGGINTGKGIGILAVAASSNGVDSATKNPSNSDGYGRSGVYGHDDSTDFGQRNVGVAGSSYWGTGVEGASDSGYAMQASSRLGYGLLASGGYFAIKATSDTGYAIGATSNASGIEAAVDVYSAGSPAVFARSTASDAIDAEVGSGSFGSVLTLSGGGTDQGRKLILGYDSNSLQIFAVDDAGNEHISGNLFTIGSCSVGCSKTRRVTSYAPRESEPMMEDVGEGQLTAGTARVTLDPAFANVIDKGAHYAVFVSPEGPSQGLYVTQKSQTGFTIMENPGGRSTIAFSYRIVAKPYGVKAARLQMVDVSIAPRRHAPTLSPAP